MVFSPGKILNIRGQSRAFGSKFKDFSLRLWRFYGGKDLKLRRFNPFASNLSTKITEVSVFFTDGWQHCDFHTHL